jgi:hypothetical protein
MRRFHLLLALVCAALLRVTTTGQPAAVEDPAIRAARARQEAVKTLEVRLKRTEVVAKGGMTLKLVAHSRPPTLAPLKETSLESTSHFVFDRDKIRAESDDQNLQWGSNYTAEVTRREFVGTFDGKTTKLVYPKGIGGHRPSVGIIAEDKGSDVTWMIDAAPIALTFRGLNPMIAHPSLDHLRRVGEGVLIDGSLCREYAAKPGSKSPSRYWLDPAKDHVLRRVQEKKGARITDVQYRRDQTIGWVPVSWVTKRYGPDGDLLSTTTVEVLKMAFNTPQPSEQFDLAFPPGAHVHDNRTKGLTQYLVQTDGSLRRLPNPGEEAPISEGEPRVAWFENTKWLLAGVAATLIALGLLYLRQKKRIKPK